MNVQRLVNGLTLFALLGSTPLFATPLPASTETHCTLEAATLHGAWESSTGGTKVLFQDDQIVLNKNGSLSIAKILSREPCKLHVRYQGLRSTWSLAPAGGGLELKADEALALRPLPTVPPELDVNLPILPPPGPVSPAEVKDLERELSRRIDKDQDAIKNADLKAKRPEILADNLRYLRALTKRVGWIDIPRFGKSSAAAAILIAKHGSDLLLMKAALPIVESDAKEHGGSGELFSVLYDELQITLGNQQRYGTQFMPDAHGKPFILPLEDLAKVDQYRKEIGILSFEEYKKLISDSMGGAVIRVAGSDE